VLKESELSNLSYFELAVKLDDLKNIRQMGNIYGLSVTTKKTASN